MMIYPQWCLLFVAAMLAGWFVFVAEQQQAAQDLRCQESGCYSSRYGR